MLMFSYSWLQRNTLLPQIFRLDFWKRNISIFQLLSQTEFLFTLNVVFKFNLAFFFFKDSVMLNGFGTVVNALGKRVKPYLPQICGTVLWRLNNKSAKVRQQAADLISRTAVVMKTCQEVNFYIRFLFLHQKE